MTPDRATTANDTSRAPRAASLVWLIASLLLFHWSLPVAANVVTERSAAADRGASPAGRAARSPERLRDLAKTMGFELRAKDGKGQVSSGGGDASLAASFGPAFSTDSKPFDEPEPRQVAPGEIRAAAFEARAPPARRS